MSNRTRAELVKAAKVAYKAADGSRWTLADILVEAFPRRSALRNGVPLDQCLVEFALEADIPYAYNYLEGMRYTALSWPTGMRKAASFEAHRLMCKHPDELRDGMTPRDCSVFLANSGRERERPKKKTLRTALFAVLVLAQRHLNEEGRSPSLKEIAGFEDDLREAIRAIGVLRARAEQRQPSQAGRRSNNTSGHHGASIGGKQGKFQARVMRKGIKHSLGYYETAEAAGMAVTKFLEKAA